MGFMVRQLDIYKIGSNMGKILKVDECFTRALLKEDGEKVSYPYKTWLRAKNDYWGPETFVELVVSDSKLLSRKHQRRKTILCGRLGKDLDVDCYYPQVRKRKGKGKGSQLWTRVAFEDGRMPKVRLDDSGGVVAMQMDVIHLQVRSSPKF
ncbi:hypothetical protein SLEP1_g41751 [Rubroshorea leprosula]|uniref:Uncharacterized protein n=1 Tax=Rubroshorea leprosula TaxID=152421 RepID=A0AAV5L8I6_9ROSI|nr:hypothetical protein SLEP1_g41751 [Rubroshorea leprosula]